MVSIDKAAIVLTLAIVAIAVGVAASGGATQDAGPAVSTPPTVSTETSQPDLVKPMKSGWERATSMLDPGVGHETHQIAILLAPSDKVYSGTLKYDASERIQLVTLHGPLADGEDKGQAIWTPDGETKFALTFVDPKNARGEWEFAGNALAVHTMNTEPFIVDYKIDYTEKPMSDTVMTGTTTSITDPGMDHESHQITILLAPSSDVYSGIISYSASEKIQLVTLRGPIGADEKPAKTWTPDGETIFELTFVDPNDAMGSWKFSGNALAVHTMHTNQFTVSYSISATATAGPTIEEEVMMEETMEEPKTVHVEIPTGTSAPGCEETNSCYSPADITINAGDTVHWMNVDSAAHTVTAGTSADVQIEVFDSSLIMADGTWSHEFNDAGIYDYFCMIHPWMIGTVTVN